MLGLDDFLIQGQVLDKTNLPGQEQESFKVLTIARGLIDKFSAKHSCKVLEKDNRKTDMITERLRMISEKVISDDFEMEKKYQNNSFYLTLYKASKTERIKMLIPVSILFGTGIASAIKLWTDEDGYVKSKVFGILDLKKEILNFRDTNKAGYPMFVIRYEHESSNGVITKTVCVKHDEIDKTLTKFNEGSHFNSIILISQFIISKGNLPSKLRVHFGSKCDKLFLLTACESKNKDAVKKASVSLTNFIPCSILNSLISCNEDLHAFQSAFRCRLIFPIKANALCFEKQDDLLLFARFAYKVIFFLQKIMDVALVCPFYKSHKSRLSSFLTYLIRKSKLIECLFTQEVPPPDLSIAQRKRWENSHIVHAFGPTTRVYEKPNKYQFSLLKEIHEKYIYSLRRQLPYLKKIHEVTMDLIENTEGIYLIKVLWVTLADSKHTSLPVIDSLKHISLFSATEGSGYSKGKKNRQLVCCGDYCSLLRKNDFETREKIEFLMKHYMEYAGTLFELMKLQDILNIDTVHHLLDRAKRPVTPITNQMQYKILRKIILEDREDKYSLRSLILNLPSELVRELNIILQENTNVVAMNIYIEKNNSIGGNLNKKLHWEFELVPVCDKCYKIYSKRVKMQKETISLNKTRAKILKKDLLSKSKSKLHISFQPL